MTTDTPGRRTRACRAAIYVVLVAAMMVGLTACSEDGDDSPDATSGGSSGNVTGGINTEVTVGNAAITIKSLQAAFQPVAPAQRLSDEALVAPAAGVTFYQARVVIENRGQVPLRVDPEDFVCQVGNVISTIEPTRSGPAARSLIYGTSLDVVLTFRGATGVEPTLIYNPTWYSGLIIFSADVPSQGSGAGASESGSTTTTGATVVE